MKISVENLSIGYHSALLQHISMHAESGSLIGLIGENGIGKSTLLKTLANLIPKLDGKIFINGKSLTEYTPTDLAKIISIVTTERIAISHFKIEDVVAFGRYPHGQWLKNVSKEDHAVVLAAIEQVGANHLLGKNINELSDGEYQRVMIARCLAQDTPVILLDEPTAFLDLNGKYEIVNLLQNLAHKQDKLIIFSSHDLSLAIRYVTKIWFIAKSHVIEETPEDLILSGQINQLLTSHLLHFNAISGEIEPKMELHKHMRLSGDEKAVKWTQNALEKLVYTKTNAVLFPSLQVKKTKEYYQWIYKADNDSKEIEFYTLNELSLFLKRLT